MISDEDVCCSVVFGSLVGVFSIMWSELLMTSAICCPMWSSVCGWHKVECTFTSSVRVLSVCFGFRGELGFLNCNDICMWGVYKPFERLNFFVFDSVYVDRQYDETSLTFTAESVCLCGVCSPVVVIGLSMIFFLT